MRGIDDAVDHEGIAASGNVIEPAADSEVIVEQVKTLFELKIQRKIIGKALGARFAQKLHLVVQEIERESGAGFHRIGDFELVKDGKREQGEISPGKKAVGSVPGIGSGLLRAENRVVDVEVEDLIGAGTGAGVGAHHHVSFAEVAAQGNLESVIGVVASVLENEVAADGVVASVVNKSAGAAALKVFGLRVDGCGKLLFKADTPIDKARDAEIGGIGSEGSENGCCGGDASGRRGAVGVGGEKCVLASTRKRTGYEKDWGFFVDEADAGGELGVSRVVEDVGSGEARSDFVVVDEIVPIKANARLDEEAVGEAPAIFGIGADFGVVFLVQGRGSEGGVTGAGETAVGGSGEAEIGRGERIVAAEESDGAAGKIRVVDNVIEIDSDLEVMAAVPLAGREIEICKSLPAAGVGFLGQVIVSAGGVGIHEVREASVGSEAVIVLDEGESGLEKLSSGEVMLIFDAGDVGGCDVFGIGELRTPRG